MEEAAGAGEVYCAVGKEQWNWKANLRWVLANFPGRRLVLAHVHRPPHRINMMGAWVPVSQVGAAMVAACRKFEEDEASEALDQLIRICKTHRVLARKVIVSGDDVAEGLVQLLADHGVGELVMGAAADRSYSRKMRAPKSKKAATVLLKASPSCRIWFVCKGKPVRTREASGEGVMTRGEPSTASTSPRPTASDCSTSASSSHRHGDGADEPVGIHDSTTPSQQHDSMDDALAEKLKAEESRPQPEAVVESMPGVIDCDHGVNVLRIGLLELEAATGRFDESARIGSAGVYRGSLRGMSVAVTVISPDAAVGEARFAREFEAIGRVRHPGLVALVGACPEARAVVHELVRGESLEDRLDQGGNGPLPWMARCHVAHQVCSALAFLHASAKTVHGDVRPTNILLLDQGDERRSSIKLAGLGMRGLLAQAEQQRAGREALAYVDKRYLATGEPTPQSDVHALGLLLLRLVTGLPARWAKKASLEAAAAGGGGRAWHQVVDASAGGWPTEVATEVALLGLRCCAVSDGRAPCHPAGELLEEARAVLEATMDAAPGRTWSSSLLSSSETEACNGGAARRAARPTSSAR